MVANKESHDQQMDVTIEGNDNEDNRKWRENDGAIWFF